MSGRPPHPRLADTEWLHARYVTDGARCEDIAAELGVSLSGVWRALKRRGIPIRPRQGHTRRALADVTDTEFRDAVTASRSLAEVAARFGVHHTTVRAEMTYRGVPMPDRTHTRGSLDGWVAANEERAQSAAAETVPAAIRVLKTRRGLDPATTAVLVARIEHPAAPLSVLAEKTGLTKDAYAARLRRALAGAR